MTNKEDLEKYKKKNLITFSVNIIQKQNKSGKWKKEIIFPKNWDKYNENKTYFNEKYNGLALLTGKINQIIVIDIDNMEHWNNFLNKNNENEPDTVKTISGSGGRHYYFKYTDDLENIKSNSKCFGSEYDIDIRTNGGCIIVPPTTYYSNQENKHVNYKWEKSIFDYQLKEIPKWIKKLLLKKITKEKNYENSNENKNINCDKLQSGDINIDFEIDDNLDLQKLNIDNDEVDINFSDDDIETFMNFLSVDRCDNYSDWVNIGMCLFNINRQYLYLWRKWSQKSDKYENRACEKKWNSFKRDKNGFKMGSLLRWAKLDSPLQYEMFIKKKKLNSMIISKYPNDKLMLGETVNVNEKCNYTHIHNKECLIKGSEHADMPTSMYVEVLDKFMTIKCRHPECFGKTYPCSHILMNKNEMNIAFHGDVNITINQGQDEELVEFQKIDIYDDQELNKLVYKSLNGEASSLAKIIHYFNENQFIYGEDGNWYMYANHKWKEIGIKNTKLRYLIEPKLTELYSSLIDYYKINDYDKNKIKTLKTILKSFDNTSLKNNIMIELIDIYSEINNPKQDFTKKLDSNKYIIGFENGVYDINTFEFREGKYNDYITLSVGYDYQENYSDKYKDLLQFLEDIQPNKEERDYMLTYLSIGLVGNLLELFTILTGCGRNGKSKLIELMKFTLGDYFGSVQSQLFTRPRPDANSPDPGLLSLAKKRIVIASEPEKNSKLNSGFIKFITGRDSTTLRNCHSNNMIDFTANFITLLICNDIPDCDDIDNAFSKRLRCINFPTEFVLEPITDNQKKINVDINKNFDLWKSDFILLLIEYYKKYIKNNELKPTNNILKWTGQYKEETDMYLQFLNEYLVETNDDNDRVFCLELYACFKDWFKSGNPNSKIPSDREFTKNLRKYKKVEEGIRIGERVRRGIKKHKLIEL